jgi:hypothetical protein
MAEGRAQTEPVAEEGKAHVIERAVNWEREERERDECNTNSNGEERKNTQGDEESIPSRKGSDVRKAHGLPLALRRGRRRRSARIGTAATSCGRCGSSRRNCHHSGGWWRRCLHRAGGHGDWRGTDHSSRVRLQQRTGVMHAPQ